MHTHTQLRIFSIIYIYIGKIFACACTFWMLHSPQICSHAPAGTAAWPRKNFAEIFGADAESDFSDSDEEEEDPSVGSCG